MKVLAFIVAATVFEAVGDAVMRIALHYHVMPWRLALFASATVLLALYGAFLNLAPVEFAEAAGIYIASLFIMFQLGAAAFGFKAAGSAPCHSASLQWPFASAHGKRSRKRAGLKPSLYKSKEEEQSGGRKIPTLKNRGWGTRRHKPQNGWARQDY